MGGVDNVVEVVNDDLVAGDLVDGGQQYATAVDTTTADVDVVVFDRIIENPYADDLIWDLLLLQLNLAIEVRAVSSITADLIWKWQARNKNGTWVDLHSAVTETDPNTTYLARNRSGVKISYPEVVIANLDEVPFDLQLLLQCNEANEGRARVAGSSYTRFRARRKLVY